MNNKHLKVTIVTSLALCVFTFLLFWLIEGLNYGIIVGVIVLIVSFVSLHYLFSRSNTTLNNLIKQYSNEGILYGNSAGFMHDGTEIIGALLITKVQLIFAPINQKSHVLLFKINEISNFFLVNGLLHIIHENYDYTFKVFHSSEIVEILSDLKK